MAILENIIIMRFCCCFKLMSSQHTPGWGVGGPVQFACCLCKMNKSRLV